MYHLNSVTASSELPPPSLSLITSYCVAFSANDGRARGNGDPGEEGEGPGRNTQRVGMGNDVWGLARTRQRGTFRTKDQFLFEVSLKLSAFVSSLASFWGCLFP